VNVNGSFFNPKKFILREVLMSRKFVSGNHVFGPHDKALRTVVFWADFQHEVPMVRLSPYPRSPSFFSSRRGFGAAWDVVTELGCADRV